MNTFLHACVVPEVESRDLGMLGKCSHGVKCQALDKESKTEPWNLRMY